MTEIPKKFGEAVRRLREGLGLSQEAFAVKAGIHRTYVSSIELGKVQISIVIAQQLAEALSVSQTLIWRELEKLDAAEKMPNKSEA